MKYLKRYSLILFAVVILAAAVPVQAFAVDPVSAAVISNAFAQAVAAYGASNGVAMTFDVSNTDGIGEGVHELWKNFREDNLDADDYDTLAAALFPHLYYKAASAVAGAASAYSVGVKITSEYAEEFDNFYNWLLSGPAEMVKVDNQYFEFQQAQIGEEANPIITYSTSTFLPLPIMSNPSIDMATFNNMKLLVDGSSDIAFSSNNSDVYVFGYSTSVSFVSFSPFTVSYLYRWSNGSLSTNLNTCSCNSPYTTIIDGVSYNYYFSEVVVYKLQDNYTLYFPIYSNSSDGVSAIISSVSDPDTIGVQAYADSGIADIPDTADPNYDALQRARDIPLNIPWDDTLYGDGTGTLSDAQSGTIANDVSLAIETDRVVELAEEAEAVQPAPAPSEVILPFIPVTLPHFDFSLSGIWHYVREWVSSLGAWLSTMFAVWNNLPWAMVVPVYASLVIVIVLGLYKRFFM